MYLFHSSAEKMLMLGDFDLNSVQRYTDSLKDIFKLTMLDQEIIFRNQVHELHRLYSVQKTLMKDLHLQEHETYNLWKENDQSWSQETRLPADSIPMLGSRVSSSQKLLGEWKGNNYHKFQRGPFGLQLLPDQYTNLGDDNLPNKRKVGDHLKEAIYVNSQQDADFSDPLDLRLSLSLGVATGKKEDTRRSWYGKNSNTFPRIVIDLEESNERTSDEEAKHPPSDFVAKVADSGGKHDSEVTVISNPVTSRSMKKELCCGIAESSSFVMDSKCCIDWSCSDQGSKRLDNMAHENFLARKQQFKSYGVRHLDLNEVQLGDSSCHLNDAIAAHPSTTSLSGGFSELVSRSRKTLCPTAFGIKEIKFSNNNFEMLQQEDGVKLALMNSNSKDRRKDVQVRNSELNGKNECETSFVGLACISSTQTNLSQEHGSHHSNTQNGRDVLMPELQTDPAHGLNTARAVAMQVNCKKTEKGGTLLCSDKTQIIIEDEHPDQSPTSGKSSCISDNDSSPVRTMQSRIEPYDSNLPASDQFSGTHERSQVVETFSSELDQRSSDSNEMKHECNNNREESAEVDDLLRTAAESLIHLSLENPAFHHESSTKTESNELENEDKGNRRCTSDYFELMTLQLTESSVDVYSVASKPFEISELEGKDFSIKLRRGRRLKDFQRDILPGLACLSRHEIREDVNILEGVLRSREYKRMRAKMGNGESWCTPMRGKRSRLTYVGRKSFR
ncbi:hypothetical protein ES288_D12G259300v1 [Gossypium darwinii]|uniref:Uncharacterized protein n=1 Tax=Gossypium darwinii TaxID=34276 RepID=A0A5D2ADF0_GOSDA|nr:hypothetical protein ES288_D12G259300v1 [Gossypium darwinii]TYG42470.1 hypothetical protein ES288_D12G259300v1 [Gossypium darwinii]